MDNNTIDSLLSYSSNEYKVLKKDNQGFEVGNDQLRYEYSLYCSAGQDQVLLDTLTKSSIHLEGGIINDPKKDLGYYIDRIVLLTSPMDQEDSYILFESEIEQVSSPEDYHDKKFFNFVKVMNDFSKECRKPAFVEPDDELFKKASCFLQQTLESSGFLDIHKRWFLEYHKDSRPGLIRRALDVLRYNKQRYNI